jgi:hypothetical protein
VPFARIWMHKAGLPAREHELRWWPRLLALCVWRWACGGLHVVDGGEIEGGEGIGLHIRFLLLSFSSFLYTVTGCNHRKHPTDRPCRSLLCLTAPKRST